MNISAESDETRSENKMQRIRCAENPDDNVANALDVTTSLVRRTQLGFTRFDGQQMIVHTAKRVSTKPGQSH